MRGGEEINTCEEIEDEKEIKPCTSHEEIKDRDAIKSCEKTLECEEVRDHRENKNYHAINAAWQRDWFGLPSTL